LGSGEHKVGAEVFVSWNKHEYIERDEEKMNIDGIEINVN
jgi:hypothetical protein